MERTIWITTTVIALALAAFFGVKGLTSGKQTQAEREQAAAISRELDQSRRATLDAERRAKQEMDARQMAEDTARQRAEAEARRLAQAQAESQEQELARKRAESEAAKAAAAIEQMRLEKARIETEARKLAELRAMEAAEAQRKLADAQKALSETERLKNAEIERQAALIASYSRQPAPMPAAPKADAGTKAPHARRFILPPDFKRNSHYYLPLITAEE
jgi:hypothetical protein